MKEYREYREFTVTADHLILLRRLNVNDFDGPQIAGKRPYGNGDVEGDIARLLGWELFEDHGGENHMSAEQFNHAQRLHREMAIVLQIVLKAARFEPGLYRTTSPYSADWAAVV